VDWGDVMAMPNFFIVGAQKAGTTSLYHYLEQHPEVYMSSRKEPHFFDGMQSRYRWARGRMPPVTDPEDYRALFRGVNNEKAVGEASTSYIYSSLAPVQIEKSLPNARIIAILRNPADRAYSNFLHCVRSGREPLTSFAEALRAEEARKRDNWAPLWYYKEKGFYYPQVKRYLDVFDHDQVKIYLYDDLRAKPLDVLRDMFGFLGVDETFVPDLTVEHNTAGLPRNKRLYVMVQRLGVWNPALKVDALERFLPAGSIRRIKSRFFAAPPPFPAEVRQQLLDAYREDIQELEDLIQRDLSHWLEGNDRPQVSADD